MRERVPLLGSSLLCALCGCTQVGERVAELTSVRVSLSSPSESALGVEGSPVMVSELNFDLTALDDLGAVAGGDYQVDAYLASGGGRLSLRDPCTGKGGTTVDGGDAPDWLLGRYTLRAGQAKGLRVPLTDPVLGPLLFGRVTLALSEPRSGAAGATPPIYFANPTVRQLMEPLDLTAKNASYCSRFLGRQASLQASPGNKLVVSSLFTNGFVVTDSGDKNFSSMYVFTFSQPSTSVVVGRVLTRLSGTVAKFNSFTQLANPAATASMEIRPDLVPAPRDLLAADRPQSQSSMVPETNKELIRRIASPARVSAHVCPLADQRAIDQYNSYNTFVVTFDKKGAMPLDNCDSRRTFSVQLPSRGFAGFDPDKHANQEITVTGMLQNSAAQASGTLFWTVVVRDAQDVCLKPAAQCP